MPWTPFSPTDRFLGEAAEGHFKQLFEGATIKIGEAIDPNLSWRPTIHFRWSGYLTIAGETSERPYPRIFRVVHANVLEVQIPISMYSICGEDAYLDRNNQREIEELRAHGYGLFTVDNDGNVQRKFGCIPLIQHIPERKISDDIKPLPLKYRVKLRECYYSYNNKPESGLREASELVEGLVKSAAEKAKRKGFLPNIKSNTADILDDMLGNPKFRDQTADIGGVRSYMRNYRNPVSHPPRNRKQAYDRFRSCQHGFLESIRQVASFHRAMKKLGISI